MNLPNRIVITFSPLNLFNSYANERIDIHSYICRDNNTMIVSSHSLFETIDICIITSRHILHSIINSYIYHQFPNRRKFNSFTIGKSSAQHTHVYTPIQWNNSLHRIKLLLIVIQFQWRKYASDQEISR